MTTANAINSQFPVDVSSGGTGLSSATAYAVVCGGTGSTTAFQSVSGLGTSGQVLTSNGASALPTWQASSGGSMVFIQQQSPSASSTANFTSGFSSTYRDYFFNCSNLSNSALADILIEVSDDGGSTWKTTGYSNGTFTMNAGGTSWTNITTSFALSAGGLGAGGFINFYMYLLNIRSTTQSGMIGNMGGGGGVLWTNTGKGPTGITINAIRFRTSAGNMTGNINMYGLVSA